MSRTLPGLQKQWYEGQIDRSNRIDRYLDTDGDGGGTKSAIGDYSSAAEIFYIQPRQAQFITFPE